MIQIGHLTFILYLNYPLPFKIISLSLSPLAGEQPTRISALAGALSLGASTAFHNLLSLPQSPPRLSPSPTPSHRKSELTVEERVVLGARQGSQIEGHGRAL